MSEATHPVVTVRRANHPYRQQPLHERTLAHPDFADVCGHLFEDNRICILRESQHAGVPSDERARDAEKLRLAGFTLEQILTSGDLETIHALASNTLRHLREMP